MAALIPGILFGLLATGVNFGLLYVGVRWLFGRAPDRARVLIPLVYLFRYLLFGAMILAYLKFRLGSFWGLLIGVTIGIAGYTVWQGIDARNRRSSQV
jgi:hypothetical protein